MKWVPEADVAVYREWAKFITSVKGRLEGFSFKQSSLPGDEGIRGFGPDQQMRPIDRRFQKHMLPVFLERGWKRLKRLEIRGVGHWKDEEPVMTMETRKAIKEAVGRDVKVVIEEDWKRPAWMAGV
jgi:hypothetical protein